MPRGVGSVMENISKKLSLYIKSINSIGLRPGDSTINQLAFLSNEFSLALDNWKDIRVVFFDISKAFDRVWHEGLLFKIRQLGIGGDLLIWIKSYLYDRKQRVILNSINK